MIRETVQLSVYVKNKPAELARLCSKLGEGQINVQGFAAVNSENHVINRFIVDRPVVAQKLLAEAGLLVVDNRVLTVDFDNRLPGISEIAARLARFDVNICYAYYTTVPGRLPAAGALLVLRVDDIPGTFRALALEQKKLVGT